MYSGQLAITCVYVCSKYACMSVCLYVCIFTVNHYSQQSLPPKYTFTPFTRTLNPVNTKKKSSAQALNTASIRQDSPSHISKSAHSKKKKGKKAQSSWRRKKISNATSLDVVLPPYKSAVDASTVSTLWNHTHAPSVLFLMSADTKEKKGVPGAISARVFCLPL